MERYAKIPKDIRSKVDGQQQLRKVTATGLLSHVAAVITPEDSGHWKPSPEMFLAGAQYLNVAPSTCILIGDDPIRDIAPARRLGMACFEVKPGPCAEAFAGAI